jgi:uncharacterized membrane protein YeaQ/YmgE (transglycosylase-associated protein family)
MHWVWLIIVGAIVGALGRLFHPGRDPMGFIVTTLIGIGSLLIAGAIVSGFWGFVLGVVIAVILVAVVGRVWSARVAT